MLKKIRGNIKHLTLGTLIYYNNIFKKSYLNVDVLNKGVQEMSKVYGLIMSQKLFSSICFD